MRCRYGQGCGYKANPAIQHHVPASPFRSAARTSGRRALSCIRSTSAASRLGGECRPTAHGLCVTSTPLPRISNGPPDQAHTHSPTTPPPLLPAATRPATGPRNVCASRRCARARHRVRGQGTVVRGWPPTRCPLARSRVPAESRGRVAPASSGPTFDPASWRRRGAHRSHSPAPARRPPAGGRRGAAAGSSRHRRERRIGERQLVRVGARKSSPGVPAAGERDHRVGDIGAHHHGPARGGECRDAPGPGATSSTSEAAVTTPSSRAIPSSCCSAVVGSGCECVSRPARRLAVVLQEHVEHDNTRRPHRALHQHPPAGVDPTTSRAVRLTAARSAAAGRLKVTTSSAATGEPGLPRRCGRPSPGPDCLQCRTRDHAAAAACSAPSIMIWATVW